MITLTDETFDEAVGSGTVLVEFGAEWCGPCKAMAPVLDELSTQLVGRLSIFKVDADESMATTRRFDIGGIPAMLVFRDGEVIRRIIGARGKARLLDELAEYI